MLRAVLEGVGYNLKVILDIFDAASPVGDVTVIGGGAKGAVWLKILSDIWGKRLVTPRFMEEATSLGAAVCGGVGVGAFKDYRAAIAMNPEAGRVEPCAANRAVYARRFEAFNRAYEALRPVYGLLR
jgi:xylulokinase